MIDIDMVSVGELASILYMYCEKLFPTHMAICLCFFFALLCIVFSR